jgi:signal transduction histidine kinase
MTMPWPRSKSAQLALAVMASFLVAFVLLGAGVYLAVSTLLLQDARELARTDASGLAEIHRDSGRAALIAELRNRLESPEDPDAVYELVDRDGLTVVATSGLQAHAASRARWITFEAADVGDADGPRRVIAYLQPLDDGSTLLVGLRLHSQDRFLDLMLRAALAALLVAATLGALVGWLTSRWVSGRLRSLDATAERVGGGELALRVPLDGSDDAFDRLARRFNGMLDRIEDLLGGVRHATDHIAHDLRTPLTRLRNGLEDLRRQPGDPGRDAALDAAVAETDQLLRTFASLLWLARIEAQAPAQDEPQLELAALVADAVELYTPSAGERGIRLQAALQPVQVRGDRDQLFQLLVNLLDNALKYAPADSAVDVRLHATPQGALLQIDDQGPGIPAAERERVFDRFQRLESHRGSPGSGLGLSLVRAIVHRHGGRVLLLDQAPGLRVQVLLPPIHTVPT